MPATDPLVLRFGLSYRLRVMQFVAASLGALAILMAPASLGWKLGAWSALAFVSKRAQIASPMKSQSGWFELRRDGTARMRFLDGTKSRAVLKENAWSVSWFSVLALFEPASGRHYYCVVCASENAPNDYRRLMQHLKLGNPAVNQERATRW